MLKEEKQRRKDIGSVVYIIKWKMSKWPSVIRLYLNKDFLIKEFFKTQVTKFSTLIQLDTVTNAMVCFLDFHCFFLYPVITGRFQAISWPYLCLIA